MAVRGRTGMRDEGEYPSWVFDRGATKPAGCLLENPPGGRSFGCGPRWLRRHSPQRGCSALAALPTSKFPRRSTPRNFQTGSYVCHGLTRSLKNWFAEAAMTVYGETAALLV